MKANFTYEECQQLEQLHVFQNNWRMRRVFLLQHPTEVDSVVSVGLPQDLWDHAEERLLAQIHLDYEEVETVVIAIEPKSEFVRELKFKLPATF